MTHDPQLRDVQQLFNLAGRSAIVTGGSRGLGLEIAEGLAEAGASVMLCARRKEWLMPAEESLRARGFQVASMLCDVCVPDQVDAVVQQTLAAFGTVDILVNNAGISWGDIPEQYPLEKWQRVLDVNLTGAFLFAQAAGREMLKRQFGHHQYLVGVRPDVAGAGSPLCGLCGEQGRSAWPDAGIGRILGKGGDSCQRNCPWVLSFAIG